MSYISKEEFNLLKARFDNFDRIIDLVQKQTIAIEKLTTEIKYMREEQNDLKCRLRDLESKPVKNYESLKAMISGGVISTLISAIALMIGLKK